MPRYYHSIHQKVMDNQRIHCANCGVRHRYRASNYCWSCLQNKRRFGDPNAKLIRIGQFKQHVPKARRLIKSTRDMAAWGIVTRWFDQFREYKIIQRFHEFNFMVKVLSAHEKFTPLDVCSRLAALEYWDELEAISSKPQILKKQHKRYLYGWHTLRYLGYPMPSSETKSIKNRRCLLLGAKIHNGIGLYIYNVARTMVRLDREIQQAHREQLETIDTTKLVQKELDRKQQRLEKQHKQMRGDLVQAKQQPEQADKLRQWKDPVYANPVKTFSPDKPDPNGKPTTLTKVRCEHCGHKRIIEQEPKCPNGCE